ncbi:hypothetical protein Tco_1566918, partial [Tanacetum coccineum]
SPSSSSTTLSNSSRNQTRNLVSPSSSVYTPTPPQIFEIGKCSDKMYLKYHEKQIEDILNYLDELYLHRIEKMEEGRIDRMIIRRNRNDLKTYIRRFQELATLRPNMVPNAEKLMEVFINGLPRSIEGNVTASKPQTLEEAINIAQILMDQIIKRDSVQETNNHKRRFEDRRNTNNNNYPNEHNNNNHSNNHNHNNYQDNRNNNNHNNDYPQQQYKRQEALKTYAATNGYTGNLPLCKGCRLHHTGPCSVKCQVCNKIGHQTKYCKNKRPTTRNDLQTVSVICNACGKKEHYTNQRSKANNWATGKHT